MRSFRNSAWVLLIILLVCISASAETVCEHVYEEIVLNAATCTDKGIYMQHCTLCGDRTYGAIEAAHTYNEEPDVIVPPVCDEDGGKVWYCTVCNLQQDPELDGVKCETIPATHAFGDNVRYVEATCEEDGKFIRVCSVCSAEEIVQFNEEDKAIGHKWHYEHLAPSCEEAEKNQISCENCGHIRWESLVSDYIGAPATGHAKPENVTISQEADCENAQIQAWDCLTCGAHIEEAVGDALGHTIEMIVKEEATCTDTGLADHVCAVCEEIVEVNVILPVATACVPYETIVSPVTCTENGIVEYRCKWCDKHLHFGAIAYGHEAGDVVPVKNPTCTEYGLGYVYCMVCNELLKEIALPATDHIFSEQPTLRTDECGEEAAAVIKCNNCDYEEQVAYIKRDVQHQRAYRYTAPDCDHSGVLEIYCAVCDDILRTMDVVNDMAWGHVYAQEQTVTDAPDCVNAGSAAWICLRCGVAQEETVLPALGHTPELRVVSAATCYADGVGQQVCTVCETVLEENIVLAKAPDCDAKEEVLIASSCTEDGLSQYVCKWCDRTMGYAILPANHEMGEHVRIKDPTCTESGIEHVLCRLCGEVLVEITLGRTDHIFDQQSGVMVQDTTCTDGALMNYYCQICNADGKNTEEGLLTVYVGEALGHTWQAETSYLDADCVHAGRTVKTCESCDAEEIVSYDRSAPALGHTVIYKLVMPTCTEPMMVVGVCTVCGYEIERDNAQEIEGISTAALGHCEPAEWQIDLTPDCRNAGLRSKYCTVCDELIISEEMPVVPCEEQLECVLQTADCQTKANTVSLLTCIWCGDIVRVQVDAYQHAFEEGNAVVVLEATCEENGIALHTCTVCGYEEQRTIAATGHITTEPYVLPVDCENAERVVISCNVCDEILSVEAEIGTPLGHEFKVFDPVLGKTVCIYCHTVENQ